MSSLEDNDGAEPHKPPDPPDLSLGSSGKQYSAGSDQQQTPDPTNPATTTVSHPTTGTTAVSLLTTATLVVRESPQAQTSVSPSTGVTFKLTSSSRLQLVNWKLF